MHSLIFSQVILPILNFADTNEYELKLPLLQREAMWEGEVVGEIDILVHFSVDVSALLTEAEIHKFYDHLKVWNIWEPGDLLLSF